MHTEVLLNPFYQADYVIEDDGQNHSIFTKFEEDENSKSNVNKMDAVEDILLDDFSQGDSSSEGGGEEEVKRSSSAVSVDSNNSFNIRRTKGK
jgi:hypothetical protein